ncbi:MAG: FtsX-like permease family protein, partial [Blastocatellia bacterium]
TRIDAIVLAFTFGVAVLSAVLFSVLPAIHASRTGVQKALKESGARTTGGPAKGRLRDLLIVAEVSLAVLLTIGAGLLAKSFFRLMSVDTGYRGDHVFTSIIVLPDSRYPDLDSQLRFFKNVLRNVQVLPGVVSAGAVHGVPMGGNNTGAYVEIEGRPDNEIGDNRPASEIISATPDYLPTMGIPLLKGRYLTEQDGVSGSRNALANQEAVNTFWPGEDPIGKRIGVDDGRGHKIWHTIVGIVQSTHDQALDKPILPAVYIPAEEGFSRPNFLVARTQGPPAYLNEAIRSAVAAVDKDQPIFVETTMQNLVDFSVAGRRFSMVMLAAFSVLAFVLSAVGIYGLISYSVAQQTREIGIRSALGAGRRRLLMLVLGKGLRLSLVGITVGAAGALALTRLLSSLLFQVRPTDPFVFLGVCLAFSAVAGLASWIPARRALTVDPLTALR